MNIFMSYSSGDDSHNEWVGQLADDLERHNDFHVVLDQYDLDVYMDKNKFMEDAVLTSDVVIVVATAEYKYKADNRKKGVGIESQLAAQRHYAESGVSGSSNIIVALREADSTPNYLSSKLHIDFTDNDSYRHSFSELVRALKRQSPRKRPRKLFLPSDAAPSNLTRIEDVLKIIYHKRNVVISTKEGTDYSGTNRIKFELWEVKVPKVEHILILHKHAAVGQTMERAIETISKKRLSLKSLTLIRADEQITPDAKIKKRFPSIALSQLTLKRFVREFCTDSDLTKNGISVWEEPYFIDQPIYKSDIDEESRLADQTILYLLGMIESPSSCSAHLIMAEGGDGKSSLCSSLVNTINKPNSTINKNAILLRIDEIREKISIDVANNFRIKNVYDVYDLFSLLFDKGDEVNSYPKISKNEFEVRVFSGNLVVVIDGLDELYSVFQDRFKKEAFLDSIQSLNDQLGESSIILTSRGNIFSEAVRNIENLQVYYLRGFDRLECSHYFKKRFVKQENGGQIIKKCEDNVNGLIKATRVDRVSPFVVDLISTINSEQKNSIDDDNYSLVGKTYPSNNDLKDKVVFHVLRREKKRQEVHITIKEMIELFCEIAAEHGPSISLIKLQEICEIYFEKQSKSIYEYLLINPLFEVRGDVIAFRYHFLHEYFLILFVINGLIAKKCADHFINASARYAQGVTASYFDVQKYFREHHQAPNYGEITKSLKSIYAQERKRQVERAISFIVHLMIDLQGQGASRKELSEAILDCFADSENKNLISNLFIYGDTKPLDFSGRKIVNSGFYGYSSFLKCNLDHAFFSYSIVDIETQELNGLSITRETFDTTCRIGRLSRFLSDGLEGDISAQSSNEEALRRFFRNFIESNSFIEKKTDKLMFPRESLNASSKFFREAVGQHIVYLSKDTKKCGITKVGERIVHNYLTNNVLERRIYKILSRM